MNKNINNALDTFNSLFSMDDYPNKGLIGMAKLFNNAEIYIDTNKINLDERNNLR